MSCRFLDPVSTTRANTRPAGSFGSERHHPGHSAGHRLKDFQGKIGLVEAPPFNVLHIHGQPALQLCRAALFACPWCFI